jgi:hypothetical protein
MDSSLQIVIAALEKACKIVDELTAKVATLEAEMVVMKKNITELNIAHQKHDDSAFYTNGKNELNNWMQEEKDKPAYDIGISQTEINRKYEDYKARKK